MEMPFGKHKGELLAEIPVDYLQWVISNLDSISDELNDAIEEEIGQRDCDARGDNCLKRW
jgi:hypothetical protein